MTYETIGPDQCGCGHAHRTPGGAGVCARRLGVPAVAHESSCAATVPGGRCTCETRGAADHDAERDADPTDPDSLAYRLGT